MLNVCEKRHELSLCAMHSAYSSEKNNINRIYFPLKYIMLVILNPILKIRHSFYHQCDCFQCIERMKLQFYARLAMYFNQHNIQSNFITSSFLVLSCVSTLNASVLEDVLLISCCFIAQHSMVLFKIYLCSFYQTLRIIYFHHPMCVFHELLYSLDFKCICSKSRFK